MKVNCNEYRRPEAILRNQKTIYTKDDRWENEWSISINPQEENSHAWNRLPNKTHGLNSQSI